MRLMSRDVPADGRLEQADGQWQVRFTRAFAHPRDRVWRAVTEARHLDAWFPQRITGGWAPGAALVFADPQGRGPDFTGEVLRFELAETGDGCTLTLLDILTERGTAARTAAGWHECLDRLGCELAGQPAPF